MAPGTMVRSQYMLTVYEGMVFTDLTTIFPFIKGWAREVGGGPSLNIYIEHLLSRLRLSLLRFH